MASENEEKYGVIAGTAINEVEKGVKGTVNSVKQIGTMAQRAGGFALRDATNEWKWLNLSPEEKAAEKEKEKQAAEEAKAEADKADADKAKAEDDEKERIKNLEKSYIVHTAAITCSCALHESYVVVPEGHGEFIHGIPQLNIGDSKPEINIRSFGICKSPQNPSVQENAKKIADEVKNRPKGFTEKVMDFFSKPPAEDVGKDLLEQCVGECTPIIATEWIDGKEDVLVDGKPALLGKCKLTCLYGGEIKLYTSGQRE
ncbi:DUF4280 domain-containing protein [Clostridium saccharobutylicum]|uniref:DUF4280 domain-containing protein n=1 Tax=Clostridium saccharobutylicum DSM 13864 TaxID=1345695 RepID=U5MLW2_CLOSA|nr:DUF4280 domain-containing protein [Clostridium saccharobutylicum]AGX41799.1 hypothetical protein CLSA_c07860 [Clostridium saccharobutylicum DSM 13864]AQR89075.1 hypothetical protein CLOSC_07710 [Clostridium saccharobutylicum]AQR98976.1 hypothetical protein CSACC_07780 [Clostridium saccharobutylicum]AQS12964.1 hypothetical protein CLOSACC_07780 [Clostridium saccharobutylicum]MBA2903918.1 hypothetical protein [Clostridium saccharobutylicum]